MPMTLGECAVCLSKDGFSCLVGPDGNKDASRYECEVCGNFTASRNVEIEWLAAGLHRISPVQRAALSHRLRSMNNSGKTPGMLLTNSLEEFLYSKPELPTPGQQAMNAVRFIGDKVRESGEALETLPPSFHATIGSPGRAFSIRLLHELKHQGKISAWEIPDVNAPANLQEITLTLDGWDIYEAERHGSFSGTYGFIALKFGDAILDPLVHDHIKPALSDIGFPAVDLRDVSRAGVIDNLLRVQIRDAAFLIVDLTHENAGAYWEAGYAEGLGKPVLYICERTKFDERKTHFDTNHCTTVLWHIDDIPSFIESLVATLKRSLNV